MTDRPVTDEARALVGRVQSLEAAREGLLAEREYLRGELARFRDLAGRSDPPGRSGGQGRRDEPSPRPSLEPDEACERAAPLLAWAVCGVGWNDLSAKQRRALFALADAVICMAGDAARERSGALLGVAVNFKEALEGIADRFPDSEAGVLATNALRANRESIRRKPRFLDPDCAHRDEPLDAAYRRRGND